MPIMPIVHQPRRPLGRESFRQRNLGCVPQNLVFRGDMQHPPNLNIDNCFVLKSQLRRYSAFHLVLSKISPDRILHLVLCVFNIYVVRIKLRYIFEGKVLRMILYCSDMDVIRYFMKCHFRVTLKIKDPDLHYTT